MNDIMARLIEALRQTISFVEVRATSSTHYLEAVFLRRDLESCVALLRQELGPAVKDFGQVVALDRSTQQAVDRIGGIRIEQCLFVVRGADRRAGYAALWPWQSDASRVTLKVGLLE